jgi:N-acetylneuraminic acid mutarotase
VHTATILKNGQVFIAGGILDSRGIEINNKSTEFYDPLKNTFSKGPDMNRLRAGHTATLLEDGNILITGGFDSSGFLKDAELFITNEGTFEKVLSQMTQPRAAHTATLLNNGKVLIVGGVNGGIKANETIDLYDPNTRAFSQVGILNTSRTGHTASLLKNGDVLIVGGSSNWRTDVLSSCEIFNPQTNKLRMAGDLNIKRNKHAAVVLNNGNVLIIAGSSTALEISGRYNTAEIFDSKTQKFSLLPSHLNKSRFKITNAGAILPNGNAIIAGDGKYVEVFDINTMLFHTVKGNVESAYMYPTVTPLHDGQILITGGYDGNMIATNGAWLHKSNR